MTICSAFADEQRCVNDRHTYLCPICDISYGYIKEDLPMDEEHPCSACGYVGRVAEFIPKVSAIEVYEEHFKKFKDQQRVLEVRQALASGNVKEELERIDFHMQDVPRFLIGVGA